MSLPKSDCHLQSPNPILEKLSSTPKIGQGYAFLSFSARGIAQKLIHKLKYENLSALGTHFGRFFGQEIVDFGQWRGINYILPIPLHRERLKARKYNQSEVIADGMAEIMEIPVKSEILRRNRHTSTQTRKSKTDRWLNVENLFEVTDETLVKDQHILLVDDVITTGATIESAARALLNAGAAEISIACLAYGD